MLNVNLYYDILDHDKPTLRVQTNHPNTVVLTCQTSCNPEATKIHWYHNNNLLPVTTNNLQLDVNKQQQHGSYYCSSVNKILGERPSIPVNIPTSSKLIYN